MSVWEPYLGAAPFEKKDAALFFGRAIEADDLACLVEAHQVVLLYAQSGTGKSSLINAQLTPLLESRNCEVLVARPGRLPAVRPTSGTYDSGDTFASNVLNDMKREVPHTVPADTLRLSTALKLWSRRHAAPRASSLHVLVLDQFEETFTWPSPRRAEHRKDFLSQIAEVLQADLQVRVLVSMREEYIASLEPYANLFKEGFRTRRRLDRLKRDQAIDAICKPLEKTQYRWEPAAVALLVHELTTTQVKDHDGEIRQVSSEYVEPVQLSVVCRFLWEQFNAPPGPVGSLLTRELVSASGGVSQALLQLFETAIKKAVRDSGADERKLRRFCHYRLITEHGTRASCLKGEKDTGDVPNVALDVLDALHVTRSEWRSNAEWYELTHDRFIPAIMQANRMWLKSELSPEQVKLADELRQKASAWNDRGRLAVDLLGDADLRAAEVLVVSPLAPDLGLGAEVVRSCIESSREHLNQIQLQRLKRKNDWLGAAVIAAALLLILGVIGYGLAVRQKRAADRLSEQAQQDKYENQYQLSQLTFINALLGRSMDVSELRRIDGEIEKVRGEAAKELAGARAAQLQELQRSTAALKNSGAAWISAQAEHAGRERMDESAWVAALRRDVTDSRAAAEQLAKGATQEKDWRRSVTLARYAVALDGNDRNVATLYAALGKSALNVSAHRGQVFPVVFASGHELVTAGADSTVRMWDTLSGALTRLFVDHTSPVFDVALSPDRRFIATASEDRSARIWDVTNGTNRVLEGHGDRVWGVAFSRDGQRVATASEDKTIRLWDAGSGKELRRQTFPGRMYGVAFNPDGKELVAVGEGITTLYPANLDGPPRLLARSPDVVYRAAFDPGGRTLATTTLGKTAFIYDLEGVRPEPIALRGHAAMLGMVAFNSDGRLLATSSLDGTVRLWDANSGASLDMLEGGCGPMFGAAFSPDDSQLAAGCKDVVRIWSLAGQVFQRAPGISIPLPATDVTNLLLFSHTMAAQGLELTPDECRRYLGRQCPGQP